MDVLKKVPVREQDAKERATNFKEVCLGYNKEEAMEEALASMPQANAAQAEAVINSIMPSLPLLMFIFKFLICFVIGIIAALVISRSIKGVSDNPFGSN